MPDLITSHVWRPPGRGGTRQGWGPVDERPCVYCARPKAEHERAVSHKHAPVPS